MAWDPKARIASTWVGLETVVKPRFGKQGMGFYKMIFFVCVESKAVDYSVASITLSFDSKEAKGENSKQHSCPDILLSKTPTPFPNR